MAQAEQGIAELAAAVDSLIIVPNDRLRLVSDQSITLQNAFSIADDVLRQGVQSISDLILIPGLVNLDFADVTSIMKDAGKAHMGIGRATGKDKAKVAAEMAVSSPLLESTIDGASGLLVNITAGPTATLDEIYEASQSITEKANEDASIIWGAVINDNMDDEISVTVIATGFDSNSISAKAAKAEEEASEQAAPAEEKKTEKKAERTSRVIDEDDDFYNIMSIFNK